MKTNSNINRKIASTFTTVAAMFALVFAVAFSNSVSSQNDGLANDNISTPNYSEYDMTASYDLLAEQKNALSPEYQVTLSQDGNYYIMSTKNGNSINYKVGYIGQLSAPKISNNTIEIEMNTDMALENGTPADNNSPMIAMN